MTGESAIQWYSDRVDLEKQRSLVISAHELITATLPSYKVSIKWKVPFYTYLKDLCYLNVFSDHIYVSFLQGQQMYDHPGLLKQGTKLVAKYFIRNDDDLRNNTFTEILLESCTLQESLYFK